MGLWWRRGRVSWLRGDVDECYDAALAVGHIAQGDVVGEDALHINEDWIVMSALGEEGSARIGGPSLRAREEQLERSNRSCFVSFNAQGEALGGVGGRHDGNNHVCRR
jgi:hypothetical protein